MSDLMREILRFSKPKIWMWGLNAVLSTIITYLVFLSMGSSAISNQLFIKYPPLFVCVVLIYLSCVLGIWFMEVIGLLLWHMYSEMKQFQKHNCAEKKSCPSIVVTNSPMKSREFLEAYQQLLLNFYSVGCKNSQENLLPENQDLPDLLPFSMEILNLLGFTEILNDTQFSTEYSLKGMHENLLARLLLELKTDFWEQYFDKQSDLQIVSLFSENSYFTNETFPKIKKLSNDLEFILRMASHLVVDWCIDVYYRVYGINKDVFYKSENQDENQAQKEDIVYKLNLFKGSLLGSQVNVQNIIIYEFSPENQTIQAVGGELVEIYRQCCEILK